MALAIFSTWTTYGTWLPGDERGWYRRGLGLDQPNPLVEFAAALRQSESALILDAEQRQLVESTIAQHCAFRNWSLIAVNCRTNHVHVVVTVPVEVRIEIPREQFKSWCTRRLKERDVSKRKNWWTERGWDEYIDDDESLARVVEYVLERQ